MVRGLGSCSSVQAVNAHKHKLKQLWDDLWRRGGGGTIISPCRWERMHGRRFLHSSVGNTYMNEIGEANIATYMQYKRGWGPNLRESCWVRFNSCSLQQRLFWRSAAGQQEVFSYRSIFTWGSSTTGSFLHLIP